MKHSRNSGAIMAVTPATRDPKRARHGPRREGDEGDERDEGDEGDEHDENDKDDEDNQEEGKAK